MKTLSLKGEIRTSLGKKESKKLRSQELVPAVLYGANETIHFSIPFSALRALVYTPDVYLINLDIDGKSYKAIVKDTQWHAVEEQILHIDFLNVDDNKPVKVALPVKVVGVAKGIKAGGKLKVNLRRLKVKALVTNMPDVIEVNVTKLGIGQSIKVANMALNNVEFLDTKSNVVVAVTITRAARSAAGSVVAVDDDEDEVGEEAASE